MIGQPGAGSGGVSQLPDAQRTGVRLWSSRFLEPDVNQQTFPRQLGERGPDNLRIDNNWDWHNGPNVVGGDSPANTSHVQGGRLDRCDEFGAVVVKVL
jgi:hypothetical protein